MNRLIPFVLVCFFHTSGKALTDSTNKSYPDRFICINYDNDFFAGSDRYYTQGIYLEFYYPCKRVTLSSKILNLINIKSDRNYSYIILRQNVFTPSSIRHKALVVADRPYCAYFYVRNNLTSFNFRKQISFKTGLTLGFIGPAAKGEEEQKAIHMALNNIEPLGWENQISQDVIINIELQLEKLIIEKTYFDLSGFSFLNAGTLYDNVAVGAHLRIGKKSSNFQLMNWSSSQSKNTNKFHFYGIARAQINAVLYNATLQGGLFENDSPHIIPAKDITRLVGQGEVGLAIGFKRVAIEFSRRYISPEFKGGLEHGWGHCALMIGF